MLCLKDDVTLTKKGPVLLGRLLYKSEGSACGGDWSVFNVVKSPNQTVRSTRSPGMCDGGYLPDQVPAVGTGFFFLMGLEFYCGVMLL